MNTDIFKCREGGEKFQPNSGFDIYLELSFAGLTSAKMGGWYLKSEGDGLGLLVTAFAMCPGFVKEDQCLGCIKTTIPLLRKKCPNQKEAVAWMQKCMLRYSGHVFLKKFDPWFWAFLGDDTNVPEKEERIFEQTKNKLMIRLSAEAAAGNQFAKYSTGTAAFGSKTIYMAMQCTPDLSQDTCNECFVTIQLVVSIVPKGDVANAMFSPNCFIKYALYDFRK
ncbi:Concanavalin A-like lectin/glucanase, subgroup [Artemisia annua]|uniref:Concanavalin A-like lectin/glucanase, subgroup n=1 Tax=Artemisia annua TaxID=35608 RepID=A0A2U1KBD4_ARTAN|nr:Concanavalin A-like lectin/glucanase, subgroup [Artemisia annua]